MKKLETNLNSINARILGTVKRERVSFLNNEIFLKLNHKEKCFL